LCVLEGDLLAVEMKDFFTRYTNDVIATSAFGIACDSLKNPENEFFVMGRNITNFGGIKTIVLLGYMLSPKLMKVRMLPICQVSTLKNVCKSRNVPIVRSLESLSPFKAEGFWLSAFLFL
jgi:hypothetical protein